MKTVWLIGTTTVLLGCVWALGQGYYYGGGYVDNRASTPGEGYARGMADIARSAGQYNLMTSEATINMTEAQKKSIENRDQWTNTYFQMRQANKQYRAAESAARATMSDLVRYAQAGKPQQLSPSEVDTVTGDISWPALLKTDAFRKQREKLDGLFAQRAQRGVLSYPEQADAEAAKRAILAELQNQISTVSADEYMRCKRFVESLSFAAKHPTA